MYAAKTVQVLMTFGKGPVLEGPPGRCDKWHFDQKTRRVSIGLGGGFENAVFFFQEGAGESCRVFF